jgi:hypothetical protein
MKRKIYIALAMILFLGLLPIAVSNLYASPVGIVTLDGKYAWVYNTETSTLSFCIVPEGAENDANAQVACLAYPKKVKPVSAFDEWKL